MAAASVSAIGRPTANGPALDPAAPRAILALLLTSLVLEVNHQVAP